MGKQFPGWTEYRVNNDKNGRIYARVNWYESFESFNEYYHSIDCQKKPMWKPQCIKSAEKLHLGG